MAAMRALSPASDAGLQLFQSPPDACRGEFHLFAHFFEGHAVHVMHNGHHPGAFLLPVEDAVQDPPGEGRGFDILGVGDFLQQRIAARMPMGRAPQFIDAQAGGHGIQKARRVFEEREGQIQQAREYVLHAIQGAFFVAHELSASPKDHGTVAPV